MNDRIKLAKVMRLEIYSRGADTYPLRKLHNNLMQPFDPFTDANDDCAVLEWARKEWRGKTTGILWKDCLKWNLFMSLLKPLWNYQIGDYASAVLKVIDDAH